MAFRVQYKLYSQFALPKTEYAEVSDDNLIFKYKELMELGCKFEAEFLSTGVPFYDVLLNGEEISNVLGGNCVDATIYLINESYKKLVEDIKKEETTMTTEYKKQAKQLTDWLFDELIPDGTVDIEGYGDSKVDLSSGFKFMIAGGAPLSVFTKTEVNDYDLYFFTKKDHDIFVRNVCKDRATILQESKRATTWNRSGVTFQTIKLFGTPEEIFQMFDYTVCMVAAVVSLDAEDASKDKVEFVFHERFWQDVASRSLIFNPKTAYPINSLFRVQKYKEKGFKINTVELLKLGFAISNLNIKTIDDIKNQICGVSSEVCEKILEKLEKQTVPEGFAINNASEYLQKLLEDIEE